MEPSRNGHDCFEEKKSTLCAQNKTITVTPECWKNNWVPWYRTLIGWYLYAILMRTCHSSMSKLIDSLASEKKDANMQ
jgi:hypothetical protein